ncbi:MAG TPA: BhlA/UviB family holin-like peptide [Clostridium sp.]
MDELINIALKEGLGYGMFACLLVYVLRTTGERETRYQNLLDTLAEKLNLVEHIKEDVKEIKNKMNEGRNK